MSQPNIPPMPAAPTVGATAPAPTGAPVPTNTPSNGGGQYQSQNNQNGQNTLEIVGKVNMPTTQLFEATGFVDTGKQFPTSNAFLTFIPGKPDSSKLSGRTYVQDQRETMKVSNRDLFGLAEAIKFAATYNQCDFTIFTDSSKFAGNNGQGINKKISISAAPSRKDPKKFLTFISYKGSQSITIAIDKWMAIGLAEQIKNLAMETDKMKFKIERERSLKN